MKIRNGFVSNSSSSSFSITNKTDEEKTIVDFCNENIDLVEKFNKRYSWNDKDLFTKEGLLSSAQARLKKERQKYTFKPRQQKYFIFGDEQGDVIGTIFDYMLRDIAESKSFSWFQEESLR